jgi:hypothetical protein
VFFDALGIKYEYELEGFDLGDAGWYLPDFYICQSRWFVEVKPVPLTDLEAKKVRALDDYPPDYAMGCTVVIGIPEVPIVKYDPIIYEWSGNTSFLLSWAGLLKGRGPIDPQIIDAVQVARQARFEHGESPG